MSLESDAAKLRGEYEDYYGPVCIDKNGKLQDDAWIQMSLNYVRFMREHVLVERAKRDHMMTGLCYGYLRVPSPRIAQRKRSKGDRHGV